MDNGAEEHPNPNRINIFDVRFARLCPSDMSDIHIAKKLQLGIGSRWGAFRTVNVEVGCEVGSDWEAGLAWDIIHHGCHIWISYKALGV